MKCVEGIWFPDSEQHLVEMLATGPKIDGKGTYQYHKLSTALTYVRRPRCALDIGMHVGLWAMHLAKAFNKVIGFEPAQEHIECLNRNMAGLRNWRVINCALGNRTASVGLNRLPGSTGSTQINESGEGTQLCRLDEFEFDVVDFIKIDVESYEYFVVQGGERTIRTHKPIIVIEQKPNTNPAKSDYGRKQFDARDLLQSWGASQRFDMGGDCCLTW